jgi:PKD repeat protein
MRLFLLLIVAWAVALLPRPAQGADTLKVIVVDGDEAANIVAERLAAEPVIEVRDKDDRRVPGAVVRFVIRKTRDRLLASFGNGQAEVRTLTDYAGRASVNAVSPIEPGSFQIDVEASYRGQTGKAVIRQTNFPTTADAKSAGREPGKSTNANAQTASTGATTSTATGAATAATAGATGTTATTAATSAAVSAGGGVSKLAVIGLVAGGAAGAGAAVVLSRKEAALPAGRLTAVVANQTVGIQAATPFAFSVQATDFEASSLTYRWDFGDGTTSTEPTPTHIYTSPGTYTVAVTVADARQSARSELSVTIATVTGTWVRTDGRTTLQLTQAGTTITGVATWENSPDGPWVCPISGSVEVAIPAVIVLSQPSCPHHRYANLVWMDYRLMMGVDGQTLSGTHIQGTGSPSERTGQIVLRR